MTATRAVIFETTARLGLTEEVLRHGDPDALEAFIAHELRHLRDDLAREFRQQVLAWQRENA